MKLPARYAPLLFGALLSAIMVALVSAFVLASNQGIHSGFLGAWAVSCLKTWPVAFVAVTLVAPWVRRVVARVTVLPPATVDVSRR